jgi:hypothetical protein
MNEDIKIQEQQGDGVLPCVSVECEHEEKLMQGDGFVYTICSKCGEDLG